MNMTENRQLMIAVLGNNIKGDHVPYHSVYEIECALETAYTLAGIYKDLKKVPSSQQIQCTLQDLIAEGLVVTSILPAHVDSDIMIDYYALISEYEVTRNKLIVKCLSFDSQVDPVKFAFYIFGIFSFYDLQPEEISPLLLRAKLLMEKTQPDKSEGYYEEQFRQMMACIAWINDVIPFSTDKPHS